MDFWDIQRPNGTFCVHLLHFSDFGIMYQEKSGNPALIILFIFLRHFEQIFDEIIASTTSRSQSYDHASVVKTPLIAYIVRFKNKNCLSLP
jgi:hypothetical protein